MDYLEFLKSLIADLDWGIDEKGFIISQDEYKMPVLLEGQKLALPTEQFRQNPSSLFTLFNPIAENTLAPLSRLNSKILHQAMTNLNALVVMAACELVKVATSPDLQKDLTHGQMDAIQGLKSCKGTTETKKNIYKLVEQFFLGQYEHDAVSRIVKVVLVRGKEINGKKCIRAAQVSFPLYEDLVKELNLKKEDRRFKLTKEEVSLMMEILETIFPDINNPEVYGYTGVTSQTPAPFFVTLAHTYAQLCICVQNIVYALDANESKGMLPSLVWLNSLQDENNLKKWGTLYPASSPVAPLAATPAAQVQRNPEPTETKTVETPTTQESAKSPNEIDPDTFLRMYPSNSPLTQQQLNVSMIEKYVKGYEVWYQDHIKRTGLAPNGYPHPTQIPKSVLPPAYPNHPPLPTGNLPGAPLAQTQPMVQPIMYPNQMQYPVQGMVYPQQPMVYPQQQMMQPGMVYPAPAMAYPNQMQYQNYNTHPALQSTAGVLAQGTV